MTRLLSGLLTVAVLHLCRCASGAFTPTATVYNSEFTNNFIPNSMKATVFLMYTGAVSGANGAGADASAIGEEQAQAVRAYMSRTDFRVGIRVYLVNVNSDTPERIAQKTREASQAFLAMGDSAFVVPPYGPTLTSVALGALGNSPSKVVFTVGSSDPTMFSCVLQNCSSPRLYRNVFGVSPSLSSQFEDLLTFAKMKSSGESTSPFTVIIWSEGDTGNMRICSGARKYAIATRLNVDDGASGTINSADDLDRMLTFSSPNTTILLACVSRTNCQNTLRKVNANKKVPAGMGITGGCISKPIWSTDYTDAARYIMSPVFWHPTVQGSDYVDTLGVFTDNNKLQTSAAYFNTFINQTMGKHLGYEAAETLSALEHVRYLLSKQVTAPLDFLLAFQVPSVFGMMSFDSLGISMKPPVIVQAVLVDQERVVLPAQASTVEPVLPMYTYPERSCLKQKKCDCHPPAGKSQFCPTNTMCLPDGTCKCTYGNWPIAGVPNCNITRKYRMEINPSYKHSQVTNNQDRISPAPKVEFIPDGQVDSDERLEDIMNTIVLYITPHPRFVQGNKSYPASGAALFGELRFSAAYGVEYSLTFRNDDNLMRQSVDSKLPITLAPCSAGKYGKPGTVECEDCPLGARCEGTINIVVMDGYWRPNKSSLIFQPCMKPEVCIGGGSRTICPEGNYGPMCLACEDNYSVASIGMCSKCPVYGVSVFLCIVSIIGIMIALGILALVTNRPLRESRILAFKILLNHVQVLNSIADFNIGFAPTVRTSVEGIGEGAGSLQFAMTPIVCLFELRPLGYFPYIVTLPLILVILSITVFGGYRYAVQRRKSKEMESHNSIRTLFISVTLFATLMVYPFIIKASARMLKCAPILDDQGVLVPRLAVDSLVTCYEGDHKTLRLVAILVVITYGLGFPLTELGIIRWHIRRCRKVAKYTEDPDAPAVTKKEIRLKQVALRLKEQNQLIPNQALGLFYFDYTSQCWYWEAVLMLRKAIFVFLVAFTTDGFLQLYIGIGVLLVALTLQNCLCPYKKKMMQTLESVSLLGLLFSVLAAVGYSRLPKSEGISLLIAIVFCSINLFIIIFLFRYVMQTMWWVMKDKYKEHKTTRLLSNHVNDSPLSGAYDPIGFGASMSPTDNSPSDASPSLPLPNSFGGFRNQELLPIDPYAEIGRQHRDGPLPASLARESVGRG